MSNAISRRSWLVGSTSALGAALLASGRAGAGSGPGKNLIIVVAGGGWDTTYALDPKPGSTIIDAPTGTVQDVSGITLLTDPARPSVTQFFTDFGDLTAVINGLQVQTVSHTDGFKKVLTGSSAEGGADFGAITAHEHGEDLAAPYLVLGTTAFTGPYASLAARTGSADQLGTLVEPLARFPVPAEPSAGARYIPDDTEAELIRTLVGARADRELMSRGEIGINATRLGDFRAALDRADLLQGIGSIAGFDSTQSLSFQVDIAVQALQNGMSRAVQIGMSGFDTHSNNADQTTFWENLFAQLHRLVSQLEDASLLDQTVIAVVSELGRTPKLNDQAGKDHWPVTSAMVIGTEVSGGRVIGGTDDSLGGLNVDLQTGKVISSGGTPLRAGNLAAGLLELVGVDPATYLPKTTSLALQA